MARIFINKDGMLDLKSRLYSISNRVNRLENDIARSLNRLDWEVSQKELVRGRILEARKKAAALAENSNQMRMFVERALNNFSSTDSRIAGKQKESLNLLERIWKGLTNNLSRIYEGLSQQSIKLVESIKKVSEFFLHREFSIKTTNFSVIKTGLLATAPVLGVVAPFIISELLKKRIQIMPYTGSSAKPPKNTEKTPAPVQQGLKDTLKDTEKESGVASQEMAQIDKFIASAEAELAKGFKEKNSNNMTPYGKWYGLNGQPWCAMFVSYCANEAGILGTVVPEYASCAEGKKWYENNGRYQSRESEYTPKAGDVIFYNKKGRINHTGIVTGYDPDTKTVYTIEGNTSDSVARRHYNLNNAYIAGYGVNGGTDSGQISKDSTSGTNLRTR